MTFNTQIVMISGIQISSPVMKYFLSGPAGKTFFTASGPVGGLRRSGGCLGFGLGFRFAIRLRFGLGVGLGVGLSVGLGFGLRFRLGLGLLRIGFLAAALEVGGVPAGALQLESGGGKLLLVLPLAARRTNAERRFGHLLQVLIRVSANAATVFVDRHRPRLYS